MSEWFGELPERWNTKKVTEVFAERREKVSDLDYAPLSVSKGGIVPQIATVAKSNAGDNRKLVMTGDFVINSRSDRRGSSGASQYDGSVSLINIVLSPRCETNIRYWHYLLRSHGFIDEYYRNGRGIVADLWTTRWTEMKTIYIPLPPRDEQDQIVRYLDWKVSLINKLINAKRRQIELLQEYASKSIYDVLLAATKKNVRLSKYVTKIGSGKTPRGGAAVYVETGILFIRSQNVYPDGLQTHNAYYITDEIDDSMKSTRVFMNDVLLNITGGSIGRSCVYKFPQHANVNQHVCIIRPNPELLLPEYLACFLNSPLGQNMITKLQNEGNRQSLTYPQIGSFEMPLPTTKEQNQLLNSVRSMNEPIKKANEKLNDEITLLHEYRTRLISDVVTGKLDVRGVTVPDYEAVEETTVALENDIEETEDSEE